MSLPGSLSPACSTYYRGHPQGEHTISMQKLLNTYSYILYKSTVCFSVSNVFTDRAFMSIVCYRCLIIFITMLTLRLLMSYIHGAPILDVSR